MSFSQKQNIIFYIALTLSAFQLIQYLVSGGIFLTLLAGLVPFWLWSTRKKLLSSLEIGGFDQVMENLPSLLPVLWLFLGLQSFSYLYYGIGVIRKISN
jgi:hypothetical protein